MLDAAEPIWYEEIDEGTDVKNNVWNGYDLSFVTYLRDKDHYESIIKRLNRTLGVVSQYYWFCLKGNSVFFWDSRYAYFSTKFAEINNEMILNISLWLDDINSEERDFLNNLLIELERSVWLQNYFIEWSIKDRGISSMDIIDGLNCSEAVCELIQDVTKEKDYIENRVWKYRQVIEIISKNKDIVIIQNVKPPIFKTDKLSEI